MTRRNAPQTLQILVSKRRYYMKLTYRGIPYEYEPAEFNTVDNGLSGQYRGQTVQFRYPRHVPQPRLVHDLTYRGAAYRSDGSQPVKAPVEQTTAVDRAIKARSVRDARQALMLEMARVHKENISRSLRHRIDVAKAQGDDVLLRQLEAEQHQTA
jgi:hypothetical protein